MAVSRIPNLDLAVAQRLYALTSTRKFTLSPIYAGNARMSPFEPLRDFFQRRAAKTLTSSLFPLSIRTEHSTATQRLQFPFPGAGSLIVAERDNIRIGHVDYSLNVLKDRVYINKIEIAPEHFRQRYGLALLWHLWQTHQVPIVPLYEYGTSHGFWNSPIQVQSCGCRSRT